MLSLKLNNKVIKIDTLNFSAGETNIRIDVEQFEVAKLSDSNLIEIGLFVKRNDSLFKDIFGLLQLKSIVDELLIDTVRNYNILKIPYLPFSRYDRHMIKGDSFDLKIMSELINGCNFDDVITKDVHSQVSSQLINKLYNSNNLKALDIVIYDNDYDYLVCPDDGAIERTKKNSLKYKKEFIQARKVRDPETGVINKTELVEKDIDLSDKQVLIVDDICDGGYTFIKLAEVLQQHGCKNIDLFVTHGIFSKGKQVLFDSGIKNVYCEYDLN